MMYVKYDLIHYLFFDISASQDETEDGEPNAKKLKADHGKIKVSNIL